jgi:molybdate transport system substrate-binding protein
MPHPEVGPGSAALRFALRRARDMSAVIAAIVSLSWLTPIMPAHATDTVLLHAAGSLRGALTEVSQAFEKKSGVKVVAKYGPSGLLRDEIAGGGKAEVFASANMTHPEALAKAGKAGPVALFTRNRLCALVKPGLAVTSDTLLERMLDPSVKLGTSTAKADPSGDYAFEVFGKAEALKPGANETLSKKALQLTGGPTSPPPPKDRSVYGKVVADGQADIFLTYCTNAIVAQRENPGQQVVQLPAPLSVGADYGMTVINNASPNAKKLADFILSPDGQAILAKHGFAGAK